MGISQNNLNLIEKALIILGKPYDDVFMVELGNQSMRPGTSIYETSKQHFEDLGLTHVSLDINGYDGSVECDLSKDLKEQGIIFEEKADIVTNFGTSEHVAENQYQVFKTMHELCDNFGIIVHAVPLRGTYPGHSTWHYQPFFFTELASLCGYNILLSAQHKKQPRNGKKMTDLCAMMMKTDQSRFLTEEQFNLIGGIE